MDNNPAYGFSQQNPQAESTTELDENVYELIDIGSRDTKNVRTRRNESREPTEREKPTSKTVARSNVVVGIVAATAVIAFILALMAIIFTVFSPMHTSNNDQTGDNSNNNLEIQPLKQEIQILKEMLNQTEATQLSNTVTLREMLNQSQTTQNYEIANLREMLNQSEMRQNQIEMEHNSELANLREMLNQTQTELWFRGLF